MSDFHPPPLEVDGRGNALVAFLRGDEGAAPRDAPSPAALVALWHGGRVVMVFDRFRGQWELPGGRREVGESSRRAAVRELFEESGQRADGPLRFVGHARFALAPDGRAEYAALFTGRTTRVRRFEANEEIAAIRWWDPREALTGRAQPLDARLARLTRDPGPGG
ncbi:NUDIX hydrolase [Streptomyces sp. DH24]|uniref:NUDIX hydrolase n=1 Tax=Streptomyces sp. DH24 TaxID=3040123 RepID=UPI002441EB9E|nr:NUDIX hydrolase [Streptomyces sp. DH24]MDG9715491.1 NUDIX hydrolase [Streptomyces sp. DH24]